MVTRSTYYLLLVFLLMPLAGNAALLAGKTINYQYYHENSGSIYADNGDKLVGSGVEINSLYFSYATIDISDSNFYIDFIKNGSFINSSAFNGFKITDVFNEIDDFTSVSINSVTNMVGFSLSNITVLANEIWVNFSGLSFNSNTVVSLDINSPSAVPVPAAVFMFVPALLGFLGFRRKLRS